MSSSRSAAVELAVGGPRQFVDEPDVPRALVRRKPRGANSISDSAEVRARSRNDIGAQSHEPLVLVTDDRTFEHIEVADEAVLDLAGRHPDATDLEQVVGPAPVGEETVGIADEQVPGHEGVPAE